MFTVPLLDLASRSMTIRSLALCTARGYELEHSSSGNIGHLRQKLYPLTTDPWILFPLSIVTRSSSFQGFIRHRQLLASSSPFPLGVDDVGFPGEVRGATFNAGLRELFSDAAFGDVGNCCFSSRFSVPFRHFFSPVCSSRRLGGLVSGNPASSASHGWSRCSCNCRETGADRATFPFPDRPSRSQLSR